MNPITVIAGPTASGKSRLALYLANKYNGVIINIDALQLYKHIPIISSQPLQEDFNIAEHKLYAILEPDDVCSAGRFLKLAIEEIENAFDRGKNPILVGGTGLYIRSLIYGLVNIPDIKPNIRAEVRNFYHNTDKANFYQYLIDMDPKIIGKIKNTDTQRMIRAMEVIKQTGASIIEWQNTRVNPHYDDKQFIPIVLLPKREYLYDNCNKRFINMIEKGAIEEVKYLKNRYIEMKGVSKAIGIPEIISYLNDEIKMERLIELVQQKTRNYAKRQITWFKHQLSNAKFIKYIDYNEILDVIDQLFMVEISHIKKIYI